MAKFTRLSFCQKIIIWDQTSSHTNDQLSILCKQSIVSAKAMVQVDFPAYALSIHKQNALRITKGNNSTRIAP